MSYSSNTHGGGPQGQYHIPPTSDSDFKYLEGQYDEYATPLIDPTEIKNRGILNISGGGPYYQRSSVFTQQSTDADYMNVLASLISSPPGSQNSLSSGSYSSHNKHPPTENESWNDWFAPQSMSNTANNGLLNGPWDGHGGNIDNYYTNKSFLAHDSTLSDQNIDPSLESTINLLPPLSSVNLPDQRLGQPLSFAGKPNFLDNGLQLHFYDQAFQENGAMYTYQASKVKELGIYRQYDPARGELKYPISSHLPQHAERPATSPNVSQSESLQYLVPPLGNSPLTTSHAFPSGAPHTSNTQFSTSCSTNARRRSVRTCSVCLDSSHNITQCPFRPCRYCGQLGHVSGSCAVRKRKNMDHRRDATRRRRHIARDLRLGKLSSEIKDERILNE